MTGRVRAAGWLCTVALLLPAAAGAQAPLTLAELERMAQERHPALAEAAAGVAAADARVAQAGRWPNPTIGYTAEEVSGSETIRWGEHGVFVEQVFPISGRLGADRAIRAREADEARAAGAGTRLGVLTTVRLRYREALIGARRVALREELAAHEEEALAAVRQLANIGVRDRADALAAEAAAAGARLRVELARHEQSEARRRLAQAVGLPALADAPLAGDPEAGPPPAAHDIALEALLRGSPERQLAEAAAARAEAQLARARKESSPDLIVRAGPRYNRELLDPGPSPVGWEAFADVGVTVPLWDRNRDGVAAAEADLARARAAAARVELDLRSRLAAWYAEYAAARDAVRAYRDEIGPSLEEAHRLVSERYAERRAEYADVLDARRRALETRELHLDALQRAWRAALIIAGMLVAEPGMDAY